MVHHFVSYSDFIDGRLAFCNTSVNFHFTPNFEDLMLAAVLTTPSKKVTDVTILGFTKFDSEEHKNYFYTKRPDNEQVTDTE